MIKRLYPVIVVCLVAAPLLLAQDSASNNSQPTNIGGVWQISWQGRGGPQQATIKIEQEGSTLSGTYQDPRGYSPLTGSVDGNNVSFSVQMQGRHTITLAFTGIIDGNKMSGTLQPQGGGGAGHEGGGSGQGSHSWSAVRQQGNSGRQSEPAHNQDEDDEYGL
jgi:hypothetical protein